MSALSTAVVFAAILLPTILYFWLGLRERSAVQSIRDFFPLTRFLSSENYGRTTAAAGVSLATVVLTLVNLAPFLGISLLITISSYALSFVLLYFCAPTILRANSGNDTVQTFLGKTYGSSRVRGIALTFSFLGYISIFSMELLVGVTVLQPFLGEYVLIFAAVYLFLVIAYALVGGFRAIVVTDQWQVRFIIACVLALVAFLPMLWAASPNPISFAEISKKVFSSWHAGWAFCLGIVTMNLPAPISDSGTWQRLCSTRSEQDAKRGLVRAISLFILIWAGIIIFACYIAQVAVATGRFDPQTSSLMTFIVSSLATSGTLHMLLLFIFILGLFAAMISTADSLLIVAAQMFSIDFLRLQESDSSDAAKLRTARMTLAGVALTSFAVFTVFHFIKFDVVQLIFAIYGAQLALFPATVAALFLKNRLDCRRASLAAVISIFGGFAGAWAAAIYGKFGGNANWLYNAPVVALLGSAALFFLLSVPAWRKPTVSATGSPPRK